MTPDAPVLDIKDFSVVYRTPGGDVRAVNEVNLALHAGEVVGLADLNSWSLGTMLYWAESQQALQLGAWWWFIPPGLAVALMGTALVLLNTGIDELGNPRLRDAIHASKIGGRRQRPADPTPVLHTAPPARSRIGSFAHSFSRSSLLDDSNGAAGWQARRPGGQR